MKNVIITGVTGVVGRALINYLLKKKIKVLAIIRENSNKKSSFPEDENLELIECDLCNLDNLEISQKNYDTFFHLAWEGTFGDERNDYYLQNLNIKYTLDAVKLASRAGCKTFIGVRFSSRIWNM